MPYQNQPNIPKDTIKRTQRDASEVVDVTICEGTHILQLGNGEADTGAVHQMDSAANHDFIRSCQFRLALELGWVSWRSRSIPGPTGYTGILYVPLSTSDASDGDDTIFPLLKLRLEAETKQKQSEEAERVAKNDNNMQTYLKKQCESAKAIIDRLFKRNAEQLQHAAQIQTLAKQQKKLAVEKLLKELREEENYQRDLLKAKKLMKDIVKGPK